MEQFVLISQVVFLAHFSVFRVNRERPLTLYQLVPVCLEEDQYLATHVERSEYWPLAVVLPVPTANPLYYRELFGLSPRTYFSSGTHICTWSWLQFTAPRWSIASSVSPKGFASLVQRGAQRVRNTSSPVIPPDTRKPLAPSSDKITPGSPYTSSSV